MINLVVSRLEGCAAYIDDVVIYSHSWQQYVRQLRSLFIQVKEANLTVNLMKSEFCHAKVIFLGHVVGLGQVAPVSTKVEAVCRFPVPSDKRELMRFFGMAGYYHKFCPSFSTVTELFVWLNACQKSLRKLSLFYFLSLF